MRYRCALPALMVATALSLSSCSSQPDPQPSPSVADSGVDTASVSPEDLPEIPQLDDAEGIVADTEMAQCSTTSPLTADGTVTNSATDAADVVVVVNWTNDRGDVMARGVVTIEDIAGGESVDWAVDGEGVDAGDLTCTLNVRRGTLA